MKNLFLLTVCTLSFLSPRAQLNKEQETIKKTFFNFLNYYKNQEKIFNAFQFYNGQGKQMNPPYHIKWAVAEKYFNYLRKNVPYVGEAYIQSETDHFKYADSCFKADPAEEMAAGFDYDRWAGSQESVAYTVKLHTSPKNKYIVSISSNRATLKIGSPLEKGGKESERSWNLVPFAKEKGRWVMAGNIYPQED